MAKKSALPSLEEWLNARPAKHVKCPACLHPGAKAAIAEILDAMARHRKHDISLREIADRLAETVNGADVISPSCLRRHCAEHEAKRWAAAKGKGH